ncbi:MAG: DUF1934 domain-containing protein [Clostridia bacterium]|nr:DUF1934 domain-containing protein [Clostridia bacterium]
MKIPIDIRVRVERISADLSRRGEERPEIEDFTVSGTMKKTKGGVRIEYTEDEHQTTTTIDTFEDEMVTINRVGPINSNMVFADGRSYTCIYNTGFLPIQMRIRTKSLDNSLTIDGGKLDIAYTVEIVGNLAERSHLTFSVSPDISIIKS